MSIINEIVADISTIILGALGVSVISYMFKSKNSVSIARKALKTYFQGMKKFDSILVALIKRVYGDNSFLLELTMVLNSSVFTALDVIAKQIEESDSEDRKSNTIVGVMLLEKAKRGTIQQTVLFFCIIVHLFFGWIIGTGVNYYALLFISILLLAIFMDQKAMEYRVKKGWYGYNEFETRELIEFISIHSNKDDFNDSDGAKKIIPNPEEDLSFERQNVKGGVIL
ncbi:hypothetical protein H8Q54_004261 [Vibrio parahaemolyticus]|uniref:hypothetical protein n=1 Tax=Vibrio parahaemolyticus TaxID=670 RepID=UPI001A1D74EE|nr:hypothetical protein [Vibrio parahaemolyticus]EGQ7873374.1 hypothetical protein [Vibrio parahaemolyticus]MCG6463806.1 hypothetical protein [Vibrio parahaemolyticus]MCG6487581.1 hypothetical protein [Vibrio parahaemolyticus]